MSVQLRQVGKHTLVYTAGIVLGRIASFVMLPVYTRYLTPADYGILELLGMTLDVIGMIAGVGIVAGVFKFYSAEPDRKAKDSVISTAALSVVGLAALTSVVGFFFAEQLSELIFGEESNPLYLRLYFLIYLLQNFEYLPFLLMRAENRSVLFVTINVGKLISMLSLNILFVVYLGKGIEGVLTSNIITTGLVAIGLTTYLVRRVGLRFSAEKFRLLLDFGKSLVPWSLATFVLVFSDRFFLNYYTNIATVGIYSLAYKFPFLLHVMAYAPFENIWTAQRFEIAKQPDAQVIYARAFRYLNLVVGAIGLLVCVYIRDFLTVMSDPAFLPAYKLVPLLIAAQVVYIWGAHWNTGIYISGKTGVMASGSFALVAVTLGLNYLLIPPFGIYGAAWATFGAYAFRFFWVYYFAQRFHRFTYDWVEQFRFYGILGAAVAVNFAYRPPSLPASVAWSTVILVVTIFLVYRVALSAEDRAVMRGLLRRAPA
jgi:O-antigen/teichoic acid export membrane protein